ncbi:uncharacterized protein LOC111920370 [Lactuca sativa]|uniref:DUF4378 domain-containing protein n=1 Tax=Lactuca sativa TaxID=4236 RepID=A0A9R1WKE8_LACSA|nr:uncharacterized protein LOC111920370 [Lactuca sativa]KAJ0224051.1 hypothetical protein LSAT_V11C200057970 [Lactuca sativa]
MSHKHLHELLREDQEPFQLKNYIADRRCQLKSTTSRDTALNPRKRKPLIQSTSASTTARNFCINHVCLLSFHDSPDVRKSPFLDFSSPAIKSPYNGRSPNNATVFLHIPSRTAAMLLDAAMRIQKQKKPTYKPKSDSSRNAGFGLFGSLLKRLKDRRTRIKRREISLSSPPTSRNRKSDVVGSGCSYNHDNTNRLTSADWSEKSSDLETSCSSWSIHDSEEIEFMGENDCFASTEKCFCSSPSSPFRFSLEKSPSSGRRTPDFISPATSPTHHLQQEKEDYQNEKSQEIKFQEEDDKEQCSPVSVLDQLFEDDEEGYDLECSYDNVQRAKHKLLQKLQRFEKLAKLDPIELEKHMSEQYGDYIEEIEEDDDDDDDDDEIVLSEIFNILGFKNIPTHMKKLVSDLIVEERKNEMESEVIVKRVVRRMESWKMVESNTIDMMVELDFRKEKSEGWKRFDDEKIRETGMEIGVAIFGDLTEELAQELVRV